MHLYWPFFCCEKIKCLAIFLMGYFFWLIHRWILYILDTNPLSSYKCCKYLLCPKLSLYFHSSQSIFIKTKSKFLCIKLMLHCAQLCPTLSCPMDYSLPGSSAHGIFQARIVEWAFSKLVNIYKGLKQYDTHCLL